MADHESAASALEFDSEATTPVNSEDDTDSAYGEESFSRRTQSVTPSVYNFRYENGRRYHAYSDGAYNIPNDEDEQDRLDLQHHLFRMTLNGALFLAPLPANVHNVLDVGTGTGIWAMDFADDHPGSNVLGVDLSPIQPIDVPPNLTFRIDNVEKEWIEEENKYDFIHSRAMILAFRDWPRFFEQAYKHLRPGGFLELQDICVPLGLVNPADAKESKMFEWCEIVTEGCSNLGLNIKACYEWPEWLRAAGFVDINIKWFSWPLGPWAKQKKNKIIGKWAMLDAENAMDASTRLLTIGLGWKLPEVQVMQAQVRSELKAQKVHAYFNVCFCWARKPELPTSSSSS